MKVFVTGATGYIGGAVSEELIRRGHEVSGLVRTERAASHLEEKGVRPVLGDLRSPDGLAAAAREADGVVNAGTVYDADRGEVETAAVSALLDALDGTGRPLVYTSDQLIYGDTGPEPAEEARPLAPPPFLVWRPAVEQLVLTRPGVRGIVLRAVAVHGRGGNQLFPGWIAAAARDGAAPYVAEGRARWSFVHVDDLARAYALALEGAAAGSLYNVAAEPAVALRDLAAAIGRAAGVGGRTRSLAVEDASAVFGPAAGLFASADLDVSARRLREDLGWAPTAPSVLDDLVRGSYPVAPVA